MTELVHRRAVRALILTPDHELLLIRILAPDRDVFWIAPGGGLEPSEDIEEALRRELNEELGLTDYTVGPLVWRRHHTFNWGTRRISQREEYRIVNADRFEARMGDPGEAAFVSELRWWPVADLSSAPERLTPLSLATIVAAYLDQGPPAELPPEEVLFD